MLIHIVLLIFNGLVVVFDGKSRNVEKELSLRFTMVFNIVIRSDFASTNHSLFPTDFQVNFLEPIGTKNQLFLT